MEFRDYVSVLRSRRATVIVVIMLFVAAAVVVGAVRPEVHTAESRLLIAPVNPAGALLGMQAGQPFQPERDMSTHAELVRSPAVAQVVIETLELRTSPSALLDGIEAEPIGSSDLLAIRVEAATSEHAAELANAFAVAYTDQRATSYRENLASVRESLDEQRKAAADRVADLGDEDAQLDAAVASLAAIDQQIEVLSTANALDMAGTRLAVPASAARATSGAGMGAGIVVGLSLGVFFGIGAAFTAEHFDTRVRSASDIVKAGMPVLGVVGSEKPTRGAQTVTMLRDPSSSAADAYRLLRRSLSPAGEDEGVPRVLLVSSPGRGEGIPSVAANVALALAQSGKRTTLIDCDFRHSHVQALLGMQGTTGLSDVLSGGRQLAEVMQRPVPLLAAVSAGAMVQSPADALGSQRMKQVLGEALGGSDWVVLSLPPLLDHLDALAVMDAADRLLMVVKVKETRVDQVRRSVELLSRFAGTTIPEAVLWGAPERDTGLGDHRVMPTGHESAPKSTPMAAEPLGVSEVLAQ